MMSHPYPDGSLIMTYLHNRSKFRRSQKHPEHEREIVVGIVEGYVREYNPSDSYYMVLVDEKVQIRDRSEVWFMS